MYPLNSGGSQTVIQRKPDAFQRGLVCVVGHNAGNDEVICACATTLSIEKSLAAGSRQHHFSTFMTFILLYLRSELQLKL